ncbi:RnfABCDGE type electron transport complex subunit B [Pseudomonas kuykendallii]|uniref:RnfABCDGE type electron transport complex subunit B n=1 Tax=Pseudomonas kuykendallii TaxID=1007099 RepID=UPI0028D0E177|nr:RnfABCDGE type electron transport complex subunit B [Pseudomonas kuykendallii]
MSNALRIKAIDALLPQTQCGKCGHPGCKPYAEGIAAGEAINKCPPGGQATVEALAELLRRPTLPLAETPVPAQIAFIREAECIGCTKCIQACPLDAISGAAKLMHTVIAAECSGCELCVAPCPVDCIDILPLADAAAQAQRARADQFRRRFEARNARLARDDARRQAERQARARPPAASNDAPVQSAIERVRAQQAAAAPANDRQKRLKIEASMARVALGKAEKQLAARGTPELQAQVAELRAAAEAAQAALVAAEAPPGASAAGVGDDREALLKKARIAAAMSRARLSKAQKAFGAAPTAGQQAQLAELQAATRQAQAHLDACQATTEAPLTPGEQALKQAKIAYRSARDAVREAEEKGAAEPLRQALLASLSAAEQALHAAEAACGKPAPELLRTEKRPIDPALRALKTELAYARAEVSKLQRRVPLDEAALERARTRLAAAERQVDAHAGD